jgi:nitrite reductase (NO-forming)
MRPAASLLIGVLALGSVFGCSKGARDPYDEAQMDLKPVAAHVGATRHTGELSAGTALSHGPKLEPLVAEKTKTIRLDTIARILEIAPGVRFVAWTFGGQVPGPTVHARVGDRIHFSMTNRSDETMPGSLSFAEPMMHSMDFHAAMVSPQDKYRSIAPGQTIEFEFTLNYPGVFMYHCGTPMILEHIASGMYGVVVVEPRGGYPTHADREYVIIQSELYVQPDPQGRKADGHPLYVLDTKRVRTKESTYTVFNGRYNGLVDNPLPAKPGERVRLYVLNVGPSNTSSFHVVGTIFDRVWIDGNPDNEFRGMQTVLLGSSCAAIVEFRIPEAGKYVMVDHHFANATQGAIGLIDATGATPDSLPIEHHNIPATGMPDEPEAIAGKLMFESKCLACHSIGAGPRVGPDLMRVSVRRDEAWLRRWLLAPERMLASDDTAKALLERYKIPMPNQNLSPEEIRQLMRYFRWADEHPSPAGSTPSATAKALRD